MNSQRQRGRDGTTNNGRRISALLPNLPYYANKLTEALGQVLEHQ